MEEGKVQVVIKGTATAPIKQTVAIVVNNALKEAGFTEVVLTHTVEGSLVEVRKTADVPTVLDMVAGAYPHLFTTPIGVIVEPEPTVEFLSVDNIGHGSFEEAMEKIDKIEICREILAKEFLVEEPIALAD